MKKWSPKNSTTIASAVDFKEADNLAYDAVVNNLAESARLDLCDLYHKTKDGVVCRFVGEDKTSRGESNNFREAIFNHLEKSSEDGDFPMKLVDDYKAAFLKEQKRRE